MKASGTVLAIAALILSGCNRTSDTHIQLVEDHLPPEVRATYLQAVKTCAAQQHMAEHLNYLAEHDHPNDWIVADDEWQWLSIALPVDAFPQLSHARSIVPGMIAVPRLIGTHLVFELEPDSLGRARYQTQPRG